VAGHFESNTLEEDRVHNQPLWGRVQAEDSRYDGEASRRKPMHEPHVTTNPIISPIVVLVLPK